MTLSIRFNIIRPPDLSLRFEFLEAAFSEKRFRGVFSSDREFESLQPDHFPRPIFGHRAVARSIRPTREMR
jgi:hypothetical protein